MTGDNLPADPVVGTVLGETYRLERRIGEGGMATVFEATHTRIERRFAIKILKINTDDYPHIRVRFEREARIGSQLGHDHIVQVLDFNSTPKGQPYLVMELLQGEDLASLLKREGAVPTAWCVAAVRQVASALGAAHEHDVVHRDMKPENIFLSGDPMQRVQAKVLDFGISKILSSETKVTKDSAVFGTPWYMAPEQALGQIDDMDRRTDIFAVGVILYLALGRQLPFDGPNAPTVLYKIVHEPELPLSKLRPDLSPDLVQVVARAMHKRPDQRYDTMAEMMADLEAAMGAELSAVRAWGQDPADREAPVAWEAPVIVPLADQDEAGSQTSNLLSRVTDQDVELANQATVLGTGAPQPATSTFDVLRPPRRLRGWVAMAVAALVVGLGGVGVWRWSVGARSVGDQQPTTTRTPPKAPPAKVPAKAPPPRAPDSSVAASARDAARPDANDAMRMLSVHSTPQGARITISGRSVGRTPQDRLELPHRAVVLTLSKPGYARVTRKVKAGTAAVQLRVTLTALKASLNVVGLHKGNAVAVDVYLDGKKVDQTPAIIRKVKPGSHTLRLSGKGFKTRQRKVTLRAGENRREVFELRK